MANRPRKASSGSTQVLRVLLVVLAVLVVFAVALVIFAKYELGKLNQLTSGIFTSEDFDQDTDSADTIGQVDWGQAGVATSVEGVCNILVVGQDTRNADERGRSDSMIVFSINENTKQCTMVSIMRDLYVQIPGYSANKINAAFAFGGFELLDATIEENFGIVIDYNVEVDFQGFRDIIDTIGGIDIELYQEEADYINGKLKQDSLTAGVNHLSGEEALWYARTRKVGNSDFERTERQRKVIQTMFQTMKNKNWVTLLKVYNSIADDISVDMSETQMFSLAYSAYSMGMNSIDSYRIPAGTTYADEIINGMDVLVPQDWDETRTLFKTYLYGDHSELDEDGLMRSAANAA